jgi:phage shock protein E
LNFELIKYKIMFQAIKNLFSSGPKVSVKELLEKGAAIVDVRSPQEFKSGHAKGAINIPLDQLPAKLGQLKGKEAIVLCCRSGARSGMATSMLKSKGFNAVNGGPWQNVHKLLS